VGLAQAHTTVKVKRVVSSAGHLGDRFGSGVGKAVAGTDDKGFKRVLAVQSRFRGALATLKSGRSGHSGLALNLEIRTPRFDKRASLLRVGSSVGLGDGPLYATRVKGDFS
jgi:hypothetical protein